MKKIIFIIVVLIIGLGIYSFYQTEDISPTDNSDITGYILSIDTDGRILVAEGLAEGVEEYTGLVEELDGNAIWFSITEDTQILDEMGDEIGREVLELHQGVEVWSTGTLLLSYPAQGEAVRIVLTGDQFDPEVVDTDVSSACDIDQESRLSVISELEAQWDEIREDISVATSGVWNSPEHFQFMGNQRAFISFDDGHIMPMGVVEYDCVNGEAQSFSLLADDIGQPDGFPFENENLWREVFENYGNEEFPVANYTSSSMIVDGELVEFDDWTEVEENVFVR